MPFANQTHDRSADRRSRIECGRCSVVQDDDWVTVARSYSVADKRDEFAPSHWLPRDLRQDIAADQTRTVEVAKRYRNDLNV
jgi:hypothetical protein